MPIATRCSRRAIDQRSRPLERGEPLSISRAKYWTSALSAHAGPSWVLAIWSRPYQRPHPPILAASGRRVFQARSVLAAAAGHIMSSDTIRRPGWASIGRAMLRVAQKQVTRLFVDSWRVVRAIFVADDDKTAENYGRTDAKKAPTRAFPSLPHESLARAAPISMCSRAMSLRDEDVTLDYALRPVRHHGFGHKVVDQILQLQ